METEDISLPKATVQKILSEILPGDVGFSREARETLTACLVQFVMILTTQANDIAEAGCKKTISTDHVLRAVADLGFESYLPALEEFVASCRVSSKARASRKEDKFKKSGMTEAELLRIQEELFTQSRNRLHDPADADAEADADADVKTEPVEHEE